MEVLSSASTVVFCAGQTSESPKVVAIGQKIVGGIWKSSAKTVETFVAAFKNVHRRVQDVLAQTFVLGILKEDLNY